MRALVLLFFLALTACAEQPPAALAPEAAAGRDSVLAVLHAADAGAFDAAFERLQAEDDYRVTTHTEQLGPDGEVLASHRRTYLVTHQRAELVAADSSGAFEYGGFDGFTDGDATGPMFSTSPAALVLPDEPAYLDPRGREVFTFSFAGDTLLGDQAVRVLSVTARPGEGDDQALRVARLYIDAADELVGARVHRRQESVLFGEISTLSLFLRPATGGWLPDRLTTETHITAPLAAPRRFRLTKRYTVPGES